MFKNTFQSGFLSVLYSIGSKPLQIWDKKVRWAGGLRVALREPPPAPSLSRAEQLRRGCGCASQALPRLRCSCLLE